MTGTLTLIVAALLAALLLASYAADWLTQATAAGGAL